MQQEKKSTYPSNAFGRFWMTMPLVVRSILIGFGVTTLGVALWGLVLAKIPLTWASLPMGIALIFYWVYFSGRWGPSNTQAFRRFCMRCTQLKKPVWVWGLVAAFFLFIVWHAFLVLTFRIVEFQPETFKIFRDIGTSPSWTNWSLIIMGSLVAGICEEIGYRGYLQAPLEQKYGPLFAITLTSVVFVLIHLHQAWAAGPILVLLFVASFMAGYLAYATKSLLPGIIAHIALDIINFSYWWSDVLGNFERKPISVTGIDHHFVITVVVVVLSTILFIATVRKLLKMRQEEAVLLA